MRPIILAIALFSALLTCRASPRPLSESTPKAFKLSAPISIGSTWALDPANATGCADDNNTCTSATCGPGGVGPCAHFSAIASRWQTTAPVLTSAVTIKLLSDQSAPWADPILLTPVFASSFAALTVEGSLLQQATASIGTFTARNRAAGTTNRITAQGQSGAYWSALIGDLAHDTVSDAWFWIERDLGSATAQITEPYASSVGLGIFDNPTYVTIANGDALILYRPVNANVLAVEGGVNGFSQSTIVHVHMTGDSSGPAGAVLPRISNAMFVESSVDATEILDTANAVVWLYNSYLDGSAFGGSAFVFMGGALSAVSNYQIGSTQAARSLFDGDVLVDGSGHTSGNVAIGRAYFRAAPDTDQSIGSRSAMIAIGNYDSAGWYFPDGELWGPANFDVHDGTVLVCYGGCGAQLLLTGSLTVHGSSTAFPWVAGSHAYGAAATISPATIDSNGGLFDPRTGDGFMNHP